MFRKERPTSTRKYEEKLRKDPVKSQRPDLPIYGPGSFCDHILHISTTAAAKFYCYHLLFSQCIMYKKIAVTCHFNGICQVIKPYRAYGLLG